MHKVQIPRQCGLFGQAFVYIQHLSFPYTLLDFYPAFLVVNCKSATPKPACLDLLPLLQYFGTQPSYPAHAASLHPYRCTLALRPMQAARLILGWARSTHSATWQTLCTKLDLSVIPSSCKRKRFLDSIASSHFL